MKKIREPKTSLAQRIVLILLGCFLAIVVLEGLLRLGGFVLALRQEWGNRSAFSSAEGYRILCIGESTTFGGEGSYPSQLEEILNAASENKKNFKVINKGIPGVGSEHIINEVPKWLNEYQPQVVVAMIGINDHVVWVPFTKPNSDPWTRFIGNSRVYKLLFWLRNSLARRLKSWNTIKSSDPKPLAGDAAQTVQLPDVDPPKDKDNFELTMDALKSAPEYFKKIYGVAQVLAATGDLAGSEKLVRQILEMDVDPLLIEFCRKKLADLLWFQRKYEDLTELLGERLRGNPNDPYAIDFIIRLCSKSSAEVLVRKMIGLLIDEFPQTIAYYDIYSGCLGEASKDGESAAAFNEKARQLRRQFVNPMTKRSYARLIDVVSQRHLPLVAVQYPLRDVSDLAQMIESLGTEARVYFVDNRPSFRKAVGESTYNSLFTDRFAGDFGHCTPEGNKLLAENIAQVIIQELLKL